MCVCVCEGAKRVILHFCSKYLKALTGGSMMKLLGWQLQWGSKGLWSMK